MAICHQCGETIVGAYVKALERFWHPEHFRCSVCRKPIADAEFFVEHGQAAHQRCAEEHLIPRCGLCGRPVQGRYLVDAWGRNYCGGHEAGSAPCGGCGAPVSLGEDWCPKCRTFAVRNLTELASIYRRVTRWGEGLGLRGVERKMPLSFGSRGELDRALGSAGYGLTKTRRYSTLLGLRRGVTEVEGVTVVAGIPSFLCHGVLAHEMGHVWLVLAGITLTDRQREEGFCEYLAYRYYSEHAVPCRGHLQAAIQRNSDPIYGDGFRRICKEIASGGLDRLIQALTRGA